MILESHNLVAGYDGSNILKGVNLSIEEGSISCIVGPNGAGKSTVLRVISGLLKPRSGELLFKGQSIGGKSPRQILSMGIVQVQQSHSLFMDISVRENVRLGAYLLNDPALVEQRLKNTEELFPIGKERARDKAGDLSGGQQRLVEFARSLMLDPALILLDEPSNGLDPKTLKHVFDMIKVMHGSGRTILLVEQNVRAGLAIADCGFVMENGQVRLEGTSDEILNNAQISQLYLGGTLLPQGA